MRTNIVLDDDLIREALKYSQVHTKRGLIEEALKTFIQTKTAQRRTATYRDRVHELEKRSFRLTLREHPHQVLRGDRERI